MTQNDLSVARVNKLSFQLVTWRRFIGLFRTNTIADINAGIRAPKTAPSGRRFFGENLPARPRLDGRNPSAGQTPGKPYKWNTIHDLIGLLKRFYLWMIEEKDSKINPKYLHQIKVPARDRMTTTVDMIVNPDDVREMSDPFFDKAGREYRCVSEIRSIDQHRRPVRRMDKDRVRLPDVEEGQGERIGLVGGRGTSAAEGEAHEEEQFGALKTSGM